MEQHSPRGGRDAEAAQVRLAPQVICGMCYSLKLRIFSLSQFFAAIAFYPADYHFTKQALAARTGWSTIVATNLENRLFGVRLCRAEATGDIDIESLSREWSRS